MRESRGPGPGTDRLENERDRCTEETMYPHEEDVGAGVEHRVTSGGHSQHPCAERVTVFQEYK